MSKITYDKDGNITSIEDNSLKWLMIAMAIILSSMVIGSALMAISGG